MSWSALFLCGLFSGRWVEKWIRTDDVFELWMKMCVWAVWREDEKDFGIRLCEVKLEIVWDGGVVVENLSEEYWFLDSFGADLGREKMGRNLSKFLSSWEFHICKKIL